MAKYLSIEAELSQVRVTELERKGSGSRVNQCFRFPIPQGTVEDGYIRDTRTLGEMLKNELASRKIRTKRAEFVVASSRIASREVQIPAVKNNRIQGILESNVTDYFPIDPEKYSLSYVNTGTREAEEGKQYVLMVYAAPKSISAAYRELAGYAGLHLAGIYSTGDSLYCAVRQEYASGVHVLIKTEERTTLLLIVRDGKLDFQRSVNYGVDSAAEAVRSYPVFGTELDYITALELLMTRSCMLHSLDMTPEEEAAEEADPDILEAKREVTESMRYLVGNITRILDYYVSRHEDVRIDTISCCGLGGGVKGFTELLSGELGQEVFIRDSLRNVTFSAKAEKDGFSLYLAAVGAVHSTANLMEKVTKKQKDDRESLRGAFIVFFTGLIAAAALCTFSLGVRRYQEKQQEYLNQRIDEESSIEDIYNTYNTTKTRYESFQNMIRYTESPNEGLVEFIEEMEEKMPSDIRVESFSSTGTEVSFTMRLSGKSEAANTLIQLRTFESLVTVNTTGMTEDEDGTVTMSVTCAYRNPALADSVTQ